MESGASAVLSLRICAGNWWKYGANVVPPDGPIPHLLGNIWAQEWGNVYDVLGVKEDEGGVNVTELLKKRNLDAKGMVKYGEGFFTSLGFDKLPPTFWERSLFTKPADRDVVCHASAWDIDNKDDLRIKMCIRRAARTSSPSTTNSATTSTSAPTRTNRLCFRNGANDGFHEAIGDAIALAITPEYLHKVGLLENVPGDERCPELLKRRSTVCLPAFSVC